MVCCHLFTVLSFSRIREDVWLTTLRIPFDRALDFANKEKITELLFPLFVHNIAALLYHPTNQSRTNQVMAAAERRKQEQSQMRNGQPQPSGLPSLQQHHPSMGLPGPQPTLPSHSIATPGRPQLDRAHTFPTPPTSASSVMGGSMSSSEPFQWTQQGVNGPQGTNPMSVDTSLSNARSMPATPATTPPGPPLQGMQPYPSSSQSYDNSRSLYNTQSAPAPHHQQPQHQHQQHTPQQQHAQTYALAAPSSSPQDRTLYSHSAAAAAAAAGGYVKAEIPPPPTSRSSVAGPSGNEPGDQKPQNGMLQHHAEQASQSVGHSVAEDEHEHEAEYTHNSAAYDTGRAQYNYGPQVAPLPSDHHPHLSPELTASANHQANSGRSTPRSAAAPQAYYAQPGYNTPPRVGSTAAAAQASSNLYNVVTNDRASTNGASANDGYAPSADMGSSLQNGYINPIMNGGSAGMKRGRDDDDDRVMDIKRRKTLMDSSMPPVYDAGMSRAAPIAAQQRHR